MYGDGCCRDRVPGSGSEERDGCFGFGGDPRDGFCSVSFSASPDNALTRHHHASTSFTSTIFIIFAQPTFSSTDPSTQPWPAFSPNSTQFAPNFTDLAQCPVSACNFDKNCGVFVGCEKQGDVSMNLEFSKVRGSPGRWSSESHRLSQSTLRPHQISHPGVIPHSKSPVSDAEEVRAVEMVVQLMDPAPSSTTLLYHTLVQDGAVPPGFQREFEGLAPAIEGGTAREARKAAATSEFDAALFLHERSEELRHKIRAEKSAADQLVQTATVRPRKYRARYLRAQFQGPSARKDAEESEGPQLLRTSSGGPSRRWVSSWQLSQATSSQEVESVRALFGPESEESIVASPGWPCGTSSPTSLPSAS